MIQKFEFKETEIKGLIEVTPFNADDISCLLYTSPSPRD